MGGQLPFAVAERQDRPVDPWRELHRELLLEDLRQERAGHLGNSADGLSPHPPRSAEPRTARLSTRGELLVVSLQQQPHQIPAGAQPSHRPVARCAQDDGSGRSMGLDPGRPGQTATLSAGARARRFRARRMGRDQRTDRRGQHPHRQAVGARPRRRLLPHSGDVDDQLRRGDALSQPARRRVHVLLRLVLRSAAVLAADLRRTDRRAGIGRLVQRRISAALGLERLVDAHAGCPFLYRGAVPRREKRGHRPGLHGGRPLRRSLAPSHTGNRRRLGPGDGPRDPAGILRRAAGPVFPGLCPPLFGPAVPGDSGGGAARAYARPDAPGRRFPGRARPGEQPRLEARGDRRGDGRCRRTAGNGGVPLERTGQVESRTKGRQRTRVLAAPDAARRGGRPRRLSLFRHHRAVRPEPPRTGAAPRHPGALTDPEGRTHRKGRDRFRPDARQLWRCARAGRRRHREL